MIKINISNEYENKERLYLIDLSDKPKRSINLLDTHIYMNTIFVTSSKELYTTIPIFTKKLTKKQEALLYKDFEMTFSLLDREDGTLIFPELEFIYIERKLKPYPILYYFFFEKFNTYISEEYRVILKQRDAL